MSRPTTPTTPVRDMLRPESRLFPQVMDGLGALGGVHSSKLEHAIRKDFLDSLDLDAALQAEFPNQHRWDYLLGHSPSGTVIGLEPHSATTGEVSTLIEKRKAALGQLREHLQPGRKVSAWLWVAGQSGKVKFANTEKTARLLDQNGITFVGKTVLKKHLPK